MGQSESSFQDHESSSEYGVEDLNGEFRDDEYDDLDDSQFLSMKFCESWESWESWENIYDMEEDVGTLMDAYVDSFMVYQQKRTLLDTMEYKCASREVSRYGSGQGKKRIPKYFNKNRDGIIAYKDKQLGGHSISYTNQGNVNKFHTQNNQKSENSGSIISHHHTAIQVPNSKPNDDTNPLKTHLALLLQTGRCSISSHASLTIMPDDPNSGEFTGSDSIGEIPQSAKDIVRGERRDESFLKEGNGKWYFIEMHQSAMHESIHER